MADQGEVRVRPDRASLAAVVVLLLGALPLGLSSPYLGWVLALPVLAVVWVLRARVVADRTGLVVCNGLGATRVPWADVEGFQVAKRAPVRLLRRSARPLLLTCVGRRDLPRLMAASPVQT